MIEERTMRIAFGLSWAFACSLAVAACGGKVVVDVPGAGGAAATGSGTLTSAANGQGGFSTSTVAGPGPGVVTSVAAGPQQTIAATSVGQTESSVSSSSGGAFCDNTGDCHVCQECALIGPCAEVWDKCQSFPPCSDLLQCFDSCNGDQACYDKCYASFPPEAQQIYYQLAICAVCQSCPVDCDGPGSGC
jgi:hypothetical protein